MTGGRAGGGPERDAPRRLSVRGFGWRQRNETGLQLIERIADAYGLVLGLVMATFVVSVTLPPQGWGGRVAAIAIACTTAIVALTSSGVRSGRVRFAIGVAVIATIAAAVAKPLSSDPLLSAAFAVGALMLTVAAGTILRRVVFAAEVSFRTIMGAISVFTMLGLLFGYLYLALGRLVEGDVFAGAPQAEAKDYMFFSYTTLTTTGYGNLVPAGQIGQILAVIEMLVGQIFLVTLVAGLVALWRPGGSKDAAEQGDEQQT